MDHLHLKEVLDIIQKRDADMIVGLRSNDDLLLSDAIEDVLRQVYREGRSVGIARERKFWLGQEDDK